MGPVLGGPSWTGLICRLHLLHLTETLTCQHTYCWLVPGSSYDNYTCSTACTHHYYYVFLYNESSIYIIYIKFLLWKINHNIITFLICIIVLFVQHHRSVCVPSDSFTKWHHLIMFVASCLNNFSRTCSRCENIELILSACDDRTLCR